MRELGKCALVSSCGDCSLPKTGGRYSQGTFSLLTGNLASSLQESAAVHRVRMDVLVFGDEMGAGDYDPAVARTVERLSVAGSDAPAPRQEKEVRSVGEISSR
ncbi:MAG: hypothetical protein ACE5H4_01930 [Candidatus Thorarchaeota archaeon]